MGQELILAYRMLDAPEVKTVLKNSTATVVLVISDQIHESVVRQDPGIDSTAFQPKIAESKETRVRVWVRLVDGHDTAERY